MSEKKEEEYEKRVKRLAELLKARKVQFMTWEPTPWWASGTEAKSTFPYSLVWNSEKPRERKDKP